VEGGTGYYKITYQKEGGSQQNIVVDETVTNTTYETKSHDTDIWGDYGKTVTIRWFTHHDGLGQKIWSKNAHARHDVFYGDWTSDGGTLELDTDEAVGTYCLKGSGGGATGLIINFASGTYRDLNKYPNITFCIKPPSGTFLLTVEFTDSANQIVRKREMMSGEYLLFSWDAGKKNEDQWMPSVFNTLPFDWENLKKVHWDLGTAGTIKLDGFFFGKCRFEYIAQDATSQGKYGRRDLSDIYDELHSDSACELRAKSLLDYLEEYGQHILIDSDVIDYGNNHIHAADKTNVQLPNENLNANFRLNWIEINAIPNQVLDMRLQCGITPPLWLDYVYESRRRIGALSRARRIR